MYSHRAAALGGTQGVEEGRQCLQERSSPVLILIVRPPGRLGRASVSFSWPLLALSHAPGRGGAQMCQRGRADQGNRDADTQRFDGRIGVLKFRAKRPLWLPPQPACVSSTPNRPACGVVSAPCSTRPPPTVPQLPSPGGECVRAACRVPDPAKASWVSAVHLAQLQCSRLTVRRESARRENVST